VDIVGGHGALEAKEDYQQQGEGEERKNARILWTSFMDVYVKNAEFRSVLTSSVSESQLQSSICV